MRAALTSSGEDRWLTQLHFLSFDVDSPGRVPADLQRGSCCAQEDGGDQRATARLVRARDRSRRHVRPSTAPTSLQRLLSLISFRPLTQRSISRYRTGTFRPTVTVYEPFDKNLSSVVFGIDLRRWADGKGWKLPKEGEEMPETVELVPSVLKALLVALNKGYESVEDGGERRRTWIYEVSQSYRGGSKVAAVTDALFLISRSLSSPLTTSERCFSTLQMGRARSTRRSCRRTCPS